MKLENLALVKTHDLPIKHEGEVHNGKVRSVYWLPDKESRALAKRRGYDVSRETQIGVMVISDRITAFDVQWKGEDGLEGIPGKGAGLNAVASHWFDRFNWTELGDSHLLDEPHPLVWIVERAEPIKIEAIARQYITGSMWRDYSKGVRTFCGIELPDGLEENQRLNRLLLTPTTKGVLTGIPGVADKEDTNVTRAQILANYQAFGLRSKEDLEIVERLLERGFMLISHDLERQGQLFVDTKFEFGYVHNSNGQTRIKYIDEVGTPDSSRIWDATDYSKGKIIERSKEGFRKFLKIHTDKDILTDGGRMPERIVLAASYRVPVDQMMEVAETYRGITETITGKPLPRVENPRQEIMDTMSSLGLAA